MFRSLLLSLDLTDLEETGRAIAFVKDYRDDNGDVAIHAVTVVPDFQMSIVGSFFPADFEKKARGEAQSRLRAVVDESFGTDSDIQCIVAHGNVYKEILRVAEETKPELIVMGPGSRTRTGGSYLLGTNAARVTRHARTSVLVVR